MPRVAGVVTARQQSAVVVLDPWEVRTVVVTRSGRLLKNALLRERPVLVARLERSPSWLKRLRLTDKVVEIPELLSSLASYPELRRFTGTPTELLVRIALTLAEEALIHARYELLS